MVLIAEAMSIILALPLLAAIIPAVVLMLYIYRQDKVESEPAGLLIRLVLMGLVSAGIAYVLELIGEPILGIFVDESDAWYPILLAFLVVAPAEEGAKYLMLYRTTWKNPNFNFRFDGIVYAAFVSLGFAAIENIEYVLGYGIGVAPARALLAIPGHLSFAVIMGIFYGRAKRWANAGMTGRAKANKWLAFLCAAFLHGFYDACAMSETTLSIILFIVIVVVMYVIVFGIVRKESKTDEPV